MGEADALSALVREGHPTVYGFVPADDRRGCP
jgi:hypothetical protein